MLKTYFALIIILFATGPSFSAAQTNEWIKLSPLGGGFSLMMPVKPEEKVNPGHDFTLHLYTAVTPDAIYIAGYGDYAPSIHLNVTNELTANRDNFLKSVRAILTSSKSITLDDRQGIEFTAENDRASFKSRVYVFGNRVHQIAVAVFSGKDNTDNSNRFFDSLSFSTR
jgi:hypothetical protein